MCCSEIVSILQALGGSTNGVVHLLAIAGRIPGLELCLDDFDRIGRQTPLLLDLKPSGVNYMEECEISESGCPVELTC
jgi:dihydroxy-acid dehydratase